MEENLKLAVHDSDDLERQEITSMIARLNLLMHSTYDRFEGNQSGERPIDPTVSPTEPRGMGRAPLTMTAKSTRHVRPSAAFSGHVSKTESPQMELDISQAGRNDPPNSRQFRMWTTQRESSDRHAIGNCPPNQIQFRIWMEYVDRETHLRVWDSMPLCQLFEYALNWIRMEFTREVFQYHEIILELTSNLTGTSIYLPEEGFLFSIPVENDDVVSISLHDPAEHPMVGQPRRLDHHQPEPPKEVNTESHDDNRSLVNKSFDKIRQTFKCPKFSGQGKD